MTSDCWVLSLGQPGRMRIHWVSLPFASTHYLNFARMRLSCDHLKSQGPDLHFLHFASGAHCWFGVFRNVKAGHWQPQPPSLPFLRVSTNRPINHQNKLTVYKQHNHNAKYKRWVLSLNNGLWLVETAKMTSILASDWARPKYWPPEMEELIRANA